MLRVAVCGDSLLRKRIPEIRFFSICGERQRASGQIYSRHQFRRKAPDYLLEIRVKNEWKSLGSKSNTFSAPAAITFSPQKRFPVRSIEEVRLMDQDSVENDFLLSMGYQKGTYRVGDYAFTLETGPSLMAGITYFWQTAIGKALLAGITLCVVILILSAWII
ncbi:hypothetical protein P0Y35_12260 [Kiritimatiellaeota bacterium B1221]|nr:hypothetical protein [Kiritimatiellaeota bacterium B1221]